MICIHVRGKQLPLHHSLNGGLVADETLQHHHQAPRPLAERAVWVLLQEGKELRSDLGQHRGHVVSSQRVAVVQIHHCILQVADFKLRAGCEVGGELLDEGQQHRLAERARVLTKHLLRVDGLTHIQDQVQIGR